MPTSYTMYLSNHTEPKEPMEILRAELGLVGGEEFDDEFSVRSRISDGPVSITAWRLERRTPGVAEENAVDATMGVGFKLYPPEIVEAEKIMLRDLCVLLAKLDGDVVLKDLYDQIILRRKDGRLEVNTEADFWTPELRALVTLPHDAYALKRLKEPSP